MLPVDNGQVALRLCLVLQHASTLCPQQTCIDSYVLLLLLTACLPALVPALVPALLPALLLRPRAVKLMAVLVALLTPQVVEGLLQLARTIFTDERLTR